MIKKFEEFINESFLSNSKYSDRPNSTDLKMLYNSFGFDEMDIKSLMNRCYEGYSIEEIKDILMRLKGSGKYTMALLKVIFSDVFSKEDIEYKQKQLDEYSKRVNGGKPLPIVIGINGKFLTGEVYYSEVLNAYAEDEEDLVDIGYEWLAKKADEEGILDDDQPDWVENNWELLDIYEVDLDKEFGWTEK